MDYEIQNKENLTYHKMIGDIADFFEKVIGYIMSVLEKFDELGLKL